MCITHDRLTGIVDPDSQYAYGYDAANQLTTVDNQGAPGPPRVTLTFGYDYVGNRASLTDTKINITS